MGMTMTQKILAAHAGLESVKAGQLIEANLDLVLGNDITTPVAVNEFKNLKNMSIKEIQYKLMTKGLKKDIINDYICNNKEELLEYEIQSAKNIAIKKQNSLEKEDIIAYLAKKGYLSETIKNALEE